MRRKLTFLPFCESGLGVCEAAEHVRAFCTFLTLQQIYKAKGIHSFEGAGKAGAIFPTNLGGKSSYASTTASEEKWDP